MPNSSRHGVEALGPESSASPWEARSPLPCVSIAPHLDLSPLLYRQDILRDKEQHAQSRAEAAKELRRTSSPQERNELYRFIEKHRDDELALETQLCGHFVPQHGPEQFLGTRALLSTPLFCVRARSHARVPNITLPLGETSEARPLEYRGPELRQSDARVYLALLHMLRDLRLGTPARFHAKDLCPLLFGRYDGDARRQLREHIYRLQRGLMVFPEFSIQLVLQFDYPKVGAWTVALDPRLVELFHASPRVWMDLRSRLDLPDGLASWLYGYVQCQARLIPTPIQTLIQRCGSDATFKTFNELLRAALRVLADMEVIDRGWFIVRQEVHWRKTRR